VRVRIVAPAEYARVGQVVRDEVAQPVDAAARRPCPLAVSVQAMNSDDAVAELAANPQPSGGKHTQRPDWCLPLPLAGHVQLQQLALLTLRMLRGLQKSASVLVRMRRKAILEIYLRLALRAKAKESWHRVASGQGQQMCGVGRRIWSSIAHESRRKAELHGGCDMLVVEAMKGVWLLLSLAVRCSARSAHAAC
jgi:hypothetical protein